MKKIKIITIIIAFAISFPIHFIYELLPNLITSIFLPVNESLWEHMKIIYLSIIISSIIEYIIYKHKKIKVNNFILSIPVISIIGIIIYLIIYKITTIFIFQNLPMALIIMLITYITSEIFSYHILKSKPIKYQKIMGIILLILSYLTFTYLTYHPPKTNLFIDSETKTYGLNK